MTWPEAAALLGILLAVTVLIGGAMASFVELRKTRMVVRRTAIELTDDPAP